MKELISKKLLSLVLGVEVTLILETRDDGRETLLPFYSNDLNKPYYGVHVLEIINTDTLGRVCKEWCVKQGYLIGSDLDKVTVWNIAARTMVNDFEVYFEDYLEFTIKTADFVAKEKGLL